MLQGPNEMLYLKHLPKTAEHADAEQHPVRLISSKYVHLKTQANEPVLCRACGEPAPKTAIFQLNINFVAATKD